MRTIEVVNPLDTPRAGCYVIAMIRNKEITGSKGEAAQAVDDEKLYELQANVCLALANPKRLRVLNLLKDGEMSVGRITDAMGITKANVSQHLAILRQQNLVATRREGTSVYYSLSNPKIAEACAIMKRVLAASLETAENLSKAIRKGEGR
jgi:DNA-binding transcriptional ArsR family regulator